MTASSPSPSPAPSSEPAAPGAGSRLRHRVQSASTRRQETSFWEAQTSIGLISVTTVLPGARSTVDIIDLLVPTSAAILHRRPIRATSSWRITSSAVNFTCEMPATPSAVSRLPQARICPFGDRPRGIAGDDHAAVLAKPVKNIFICIEVVFALRRG
jgi:hypothetical protein